MRLSLRAAAILAPATTLALLVASALNAQTPAPTTRPPRGPAASPETLAWHRYAAQSKLALADHEATSASTALPTAAVGVTDLAFTEFFAPIGDRGLEFSPKLRGLAGQRVRLVGYMVRETSRTPGLFRLTPWPVVVETEGLCINDDTPPHTAYVVAPATAAWRPGRLILTGTLELGHRTEADGRNSFLRLVLDAPASP